MSDWKEYIIIIISIATLIVAIAAYVVARRSYKYAKESEKRNILNQIASKEAQAEAIDNAIRRGMYDNGMVRTMMTQKSMLEAEIEQLKQQLKEYE
jgi:uncharacterized protein YpmS